MRRAVFVVGTSRVELVRSRDVIHLRDPVRARAVLEQLENEGGFAAVRDLVESHAIGSLDDEQVRDLALRLLTAGDETERVF